VLVAELQHRTRNLIAVVRSLADKTLKESASLADFQGRYGDRLKAVSRVQGLLSRLGEGQKITFDELLRTELSALGALDGHADRVTLDGPADVRLRSGTVQTFALALHELATNAVKYGALSSPDGRLTVRWHVRSDGPGRQLHVEWRESGVAVPETGAAPTGGGYGRELIERALPYQLKAETSYEIGADGVRCTIAVPLSEAAATEEADDV
jgi:two-component system CheB/CheR fusion protein